MTVKVKLYEWLLSGVAEVAAEFTDAALVQGPSILRTLAHDIRSTGCLFSDLKTNIFKKIEMYKFVLYKCFEILF